MSIPDIALFAIFGFAEMSFRFGETIKRMRRCHVLIRGSRREAGAALEEVREYKFVTSTRDEMKGKIKNKLHRNVMNSKHPAHIHTGLGGRPVGHVRRPCVGGVLLTTVY